MVPFQYIEFLEGLTKLVNGGYIPMSRIDDAVRRVLRVKFSIGLFENPLAEETLVSEFGSEVNLNILSDHVKILYTYIHFKELKRQIYVYDIDHVK